MKPWQRFPWSITGLQCGENQATNGISAQTVNYTFLFHFGGLKKHILFHLGELNFFKFLTFACQRDECILQSRESQFVPGTVVK